MHTSYKTNTFVGANEGKMREKIKLNVFRRTLFLLLVCMMNTLVCHADWFKGKVVNAETGEPLAGASIRGEVNPQPGWSLSHVSSADSTGAFIIGNSYEGRILFTFRSIGFKNLRKVDYSYGKEVSDTIDLGLIKLQPTALMLQEVEVTAKIPRITMSGDTIVFNPEAFKLKEGARLADLIKKLPGVENRNGKLYWNNKPIRLMMNGKDLFGGDEIVDQLPAEVAAKLKLYDRKSELARHTGNDDGEEDQVLDIQVKPGFLDKWYGRVEATLQTKENYMGSLDASKLSDHDPQLVYLQANNINRRIDRSMRSSMNANIDGYGQSQYGSYNYQHNWQTKGADNFTGNNFNLSASLGHTDGWSTVDQSTETFFPDQERTLSLTKSYHRNHNVKPQLSGSLFAYADSVNSITFNFSTSYEKTRGHYETDGASYGYAPDQFQYHTLAEAMAAQQGDALYGQLITRNRNYQTNDGNTRQLTTNYAWQHFLGQKGSFTLSGATAVSGQDQDSHVTRKLEYLREGRNENLWQRFDYGVRNLNTSLTAEWDYWLTQKVYLNISDQVAFDRRHSDRQVFADTDEAKTDNNSATTRDEANAMDDCVRKWSNTLSLKSTINANKKLMIMPKVDWTYNHETADYRYGQLDTTAVRNSQTIRPSLFLKLKMSRKRSMDLQFAYNTTVPDLVSTFDYRNTIDPLSVTTGNARLGNTHSHTTTFGYHRMWLRKQIVLGVTASYRKDIHPLSTLYSYNTLTGVYTSKPMNVRGGDQWTLNINYDQGLGADYRLMNKLSLTTSQAYGFLTLVDNSADAALPSLNHQRRLGLDNNLQLSYEVEKVQLTLSDQLNWSRYSYDASGYNSHPLDNTVGLDATFTLGAFEFSFNVSDLYRAGYQTRAMNGHRILSEATAVYRFNKNKCALSLHFDDIFNKDIDYGSDYTAYQRMEWRSEYIHHYAQLKFTYRFDAKESKKKQ